MRQNLIYLCFVAFLLVSCSQEELVVTENHFGYLSLQKIEAQLETVDYVPSRAVDADFYLEIHQEDGSLYNEMKYEPGAVPSKIDLPAGNYKLVAYNNAYQVYSSWQNSDLGEPIYYGELDFSIEEGKINSISLKVPMVSFGVTYSLPEIFETYFSNVKLTVTLGERIIELPHQAAGDSELIAYFMLPQNSEEGEFPSFSYQITALNEDNEYLEDQNSYGSEGKPIQAGHLYKISYVMETNSFICE